MHLGEAPSGVIPTLIERPPAVNGERNRLKSWRRQARRLDMHSEDRRGVLASLCRETRSGSKLSRHAGGIMPS
jgi:hypothetical protein